VVRVEGTDREMLCQPGCASFPLASVDEGINQLVIVIRRAILSGYVQKHAQPGKKCDGELSVTMTTGLDDLSRRSSGSIDRPGIESARWNQANSLLCRPLNHAL
jgi:hypothetical protein